MAEMQQIVLGKPLPPDSGIYEFCFKSDEDQKQFLTSFSKLFKSAHDSDDLPRIKRWGIAGPMGGGKSTLALGLINAFGLCTRNGELDYKNRGDWQSENHGTIRIYDNFTEDYHRFNMNQEPENDASVVIVEHADIDKKPFDCITMIMPGDGHPCIKNLLLVVPEDLEESPQFTAFLDQVSDLSYPP